MKTTNFKGFFLFSILLSFFLLSGCHREETYITSIHMINNSNLETHLWTSGESMDPSNKLAPGASRTHSGNAVADAERESLIIYATVYAGRNGATLTSLNLTMELGKNANQTVVYSGGALSVTK